MKKESYESFLNSLYYDYDLFCQAVNLKNKNVFPSLKRLIVLIKDNLNYLKYMQVSELHMVVNPIRVVRSLSFPYGSSREELDWIYCILDAKTINQSDEFQIVEQTLKKIHKKS